jgi:tRNA (cmo5U34)-methyltransferase
MTTRSSPPHEQEDWKSPEFADQWLQRSAPGLPERQQRFRMAAALLGFERDAAFSFLDIGGGAGPFTEVVLDRYPNSTAVVHDISQRMLERAAEALRAYGQRVAFTQADLAQQGWSAAFGGRRFGAAISSIAIHNLFNAGHIQNVYRETAALLEPGGMFVDIDYVAAHRALVDSYRAATTQRREERGDPPRAGMDGGSPFPGTVEDHLGWLRAAGFAVADCPWRELNLTILLAKR